MATLGPILVTGATGMLGTALSSLFSELAENFVAYSEADLDITHAAAVEDAVSTFKSEGGRIVINAAAYTDVERAEDEKERVFLVNDQGARNVASAAAQAGLRHVYISTDFVFDGSKEGPYTEEDIPRPLNVYGRSKLAGERSVLEVCPRTLIVRTAWVYGPGGNNFPSKILTLAAAHDELRVVSDEVGCPTYTLDLARGILELCGRGTTGIYNLVGSGHCSRYEMAEETVKAAGLKTKLLPVTGGAFPTKAVRPRNSILSTDKAHAIGVSLPHWRDSLRSYIKQHLAIRA